MSTCACVHVCVCPCLCVCVGVRMFMSAYSLTHEHTYSNTHTYVHHTHSRTQIHTHTHEHKYTFLRKNMLLHTHTPPNEHTHPNTHSPSHTHTHSCTNPRIQAYRLTNRGTRFSPTQRSISRCSVSSLWMATPLLPSYCVCDKIFSVEHALSCARGGFSTIRHNEIKNITAHLMSDVCHNVGIEPPLQHITSETMSYRTANVEKGTRLDIKGQGFWGNDKQCAFTMYGFLIHSHIPIVPSPRKKKSL